MIGKFESATQGFQERKIIVWTGPVSNIPPGWVICDGNNGTPDLTSKFLRGHGAGSTSAGATGGEHQRTIDTTQMAAHSHSAAIDNTPLGSHNHGIDRGSKNWEQVDSSTDNQRDFRWNTYRFDTRTNGQHSHSFSVGTTGTGSNIENRPAYKNVIYIMRQ